MKGIFLKLSRYINKRYVVVGTVLGSIAAIFTIVDLLRKWKIYNQLMDLFKDYVLTFLMQSLYVPVLLLIAMITGCTGLLYMIFLKFYKPREFYIEIKDKYHTGYPPTEYARRTKWNFKSSKKFYFIPLLVNSYGSNNVSYNGFCGPYCSKCDHILHLVGTGAEHMGSKFECISCNSRQRIPKELHNNCAKRLNQYFTEEMRQGRLRQSR